MIENYVLKQVISFLFYESEVKNESIISNLCFIRVIEKGQ
jgi:hypothetical protein